MARSAEALGVDLDAIGEARHVVIIRSGDENHVRIQAARQVVVDPRGIACLAGGHHALDDHHVGVDGRQLVVADNVLEDFIQLAVGQPVFDVCQGQRLGRLEVQGAADQFGGALRAQVPRVGLGNGLEKVYPQAGALQGANQPEADRGESDPEPGWCDKEGVHASVPPVVLGLVKQRQALFGYLALLVRGYDPDGR